jgi:hypothetical protein
LERGVAVMWPSEELAHLKVLVRFLDSWILVLARLFV